MSDAGSCENAPVFILPAIAALALSADIPVGPTHPDTTVADGVRSASSGDRRERFVELREPLQGLMPGGAG